MRRFQLLYLTLFAVLAANMFSCGADDPSERMTFVEGPATFHYVEERGRGVDMGQVWDGAEYLIVFDDDARSVDITISDLVLESGAGAVSIVAKGVPFDFDVSAPGEVRVVRQDIVVAEYATGGEVELTGLIMVCSRTNDMAEHQGQGFYARYTVDGQCTVTAYPERIFGEGTTVVAMNGEDDHEVDYDAWYEVAFDGRGGTATVDVHNLALGDEVVDLHVANLGLSVGDTGYRIVAGNRCTASRNDGVQLTLTELTCEADICESLDFDIEFTTGGVQWHICAYLTPNLTAIPDLVSK